MPEDDIGVRVRRAIVAVARRTPVLRRPFHALDELRAANAQLAAERDASDNRCEHAEQACAQAIRARDEAETARWQAISAREEAEKQSRQAISAREEAEKQSWQAISAREEADKRCWQAVSAREEAEKRYWQAVRDREEAEERRWQAVKASEVAEAARWAAVEAREANEAILREVTAARSAAVEPVDVLKSLQANAAGAPNASQETRPMLHIPKFWKRNYWEPTVQFPIRDYCRAGDIVFDVGANAGGLSMLMSRLVGPRGVVCSFEASPRIIEMTLTNLVSAGCSNVQIYHRAIYHTSHESVAIYAGSHLNDSIYPTEIANGANFETVQTLALDDFVEATGLVPKLIKMDIEGAEFDALQGMERLFARAKPILILEQSPTDMRCHAFLTERGYVAVDLANYRRVRSPADFGSGVSVVNILFVHGSVSDDPYLDEEPPDTVAHIPASLFMRSEDGSFEITRAVSLPAGRYLCRADFSASGTDNEIFAGIDIDGAAAVRYHTFTQFMADSYRDWVFAVHKDAQVSPYLRFVKGRDETLDWRGVEILRFPQFARLPQPVVD